MGELRATLGVGSAVMWIVLNTLDHTGEEGAGGSGGHKRAWSRCRWVAAGPGRASRSTAPSRQARVWRSRGRAAAHRHTERPGRTRQIMRSGRRAGRRPRAHQAARPSRGHEQPCQTGHTNHNLRNWAASRPTARSTRNAILKSPGPARCRRRNAPRALPRKSR